MFWRRRPKDPPVPPSPADRPSDDEVMWHVHRRIDEMAPGFAAAAVVKDGILLGRHVPWAIMALPNHTPHDGHFDIGFDTAVDRKGDGLIVDCVSGVGSPREALDMALRIWSETSGACFLEMAAGGRGEFADHLRDGDSAALPGWHTISSGVLSYGPDPEGNQVLQRALVSHEVLRTLAAQIRPALDRPRLNGIKVFVCRTPDSITTEVRINGEPAEEASAAMAALPWPALATTAMARFYAVAVHPD